MNQVSVYLCVAVGNIMGVGKSGIIFGGVHYIFIF